MAFGNKRGQDKLYKQWVSHGDIIPETKETRIKPHKVKTKNEVYRDIEAVNNRHTELIKEPDTYTKQKTRIIHSSNHLYILLVVSIALVCAGLVLILKIL